MLYGLTIIEIICRGVSTQEPCKGCGLSMSFIDGTGDAGGWGIIILFIVRNYIVNISVLFVNDDDDISL